MAAGQNPQTAPQMIEQLQDRRLSGDVAAHQQTEPPLKLQIPVEGCQVRRGDEAKILS